MVLDFRGVWWFFLCQGGTSQIIPSRQLTYPMPAGTFEDDFPFPKLGYVSFLEGTPWKSNVDTNNYGLEDVCPFKKWQFLASMLNFGGVPIKSLVIGSLNFLSFWMTGDLQIQRPLKCCPRRQACYCKPCRRQSSRFS